jgi:hypothetical protein
MPGLHVTAGADLVAPAVGNASLIAAAWAGPVQVRELPKAGHLGFTEGRHWSQLLLPGKAERRTQRLSRTLLTAFFLTHLTGSRKYLELLDADVKGADISAEAAPTVRSRGSRTDVDLNRVGLGQERRKAR